MGGRPLELRESANLSLLGIFMNKNETRQLLRDLRAAVMLGQPEAVDMALDGLLAFPGVAANDRMDEGFIEQVILPVGEVLKTLDL